MIDTRVAEFLIQSQYCVLAVTRHDKSPHAAMMHFALSEDLLELYFATSKESDKMRAFTNGEAPAAVVVGSGEVWKTLQMGGVLHLLESESEIEVARKALYAKYPHDKYQERPDVAFMKFVTNWYKYSDLTTEPPLVLPWSNGLHSTPTIQDPA